MRKTLLLAPVLSALAFIGVFASSTSAGSRRERIVDIPVPIEARGCYYRRGREYCGRYCYVEVNGRRYCQERRRDAVPQADFEFWMPPPASHPRMK